MDTLIAELARLERAMRPVLDICGRADALLCDGPTRAGAQSGDVDVLLCELDHAATALSALARQMGRSAKAEC